jgi:LPS-assembly protein
LAGLGNAQQAPKPLRTEPLDKRDVLVHAVTQEAEGKTYRLRGSAMLETVEMRLKADEIDYDQESGYVEARGRVHFQHFDGGEEIFAEKVEYYLGEETGKFYNLHGSAPMKLEPRPRVLTSTSPFSFEAKWAERIKNRYILHDGMITNCKLPRPWWTLRAPKFDVIPGDRALAYKTVFRVRFLPIFYAPAFYKSLAENPRRSGFLTPNIGNSSRRGKMLGVGYYWAINRSYDATYRAQYFTQRGFAHHLDLRGKPKAGWDFNAIVYGVNDRGLKQTNGDRIKQGGYMVSATATADLGKGFLGRADLNYLSSFTFRQTFTETFSEAVFSEVHSIGFVSKRWSTFALDAVVQRNENFQSTQVDDKIVIRKLPQVEFRSVDREINSKVLPVWVSFESEAGLLRRTQPLFQTRQYMERIDFSPRVMTAFRWQGFSLLPSFGLHETHYGEQKREDHIVGDNIRRHARDLNIDFTMPSLERIFDSPKWLGEKVKHVIEPRARFRQVSGIADFDSLIRFDETELLSNTTELEVSLINRLYVRRNGTVDEVLSWQVWQKRYFDPDFGGAVVAGRRNLVASSAELTGYAFMDRPRNYSPVVSALRAKPVNGLGVEWRMDYDPLRGDIASSSLTADGRIRDYYVSLGWSRVACTPLVELSSGTLCSDASVQKLSPPANQLRSSLGFGSENKRGWVAGFSSVYDFRYGIMQFATTQVTYNTDCCGFSVQFRRFNFGTRNENQFRVAFSIANIGSFGTLKKQERLF